MSKVKENETALRNLTGKVIAVSLFGVQKLSICSEFGEIKAYEFGGFKKDEQSKSERKTITIGSKKKTKKQSKRKSQGSFVNKIASHDLSLYISETCEYFTSLKSGELYAVGTVFSPLEDQLDKSLAATPTPKLIKRLIVVKLPYNSKSGSTWTFDFENMEIGGTWSGLHLNFFNQGSPVVIGVHSDSSKIVDARKGDKLTSSKLTDKFCNLFIGRVGNNGVEKVNYLIDFVHEQYQDSCIVDGQMFVLDQKMKVSQISLK